jgi:predicted O-methyltransferase YrrM
MHVIIIAYGIIYSMKHNAKKVGDVWRLDPPEEIKQHLCQCNKIGMPAVSPYNILEISEEQVSKAKILPNRHSIIDILAGMNKDLRIMEVGTAAGDYAQDLVDGLKLSKLVLIDTFDNPDMMPNSENRYDANKNYSFVCERFKNNPEVEVRKGKSEILLPEYIPSNIVDKFDFIYLDSDHSFHNVYNELLYASQIVKPYGIIGIDDFSTAPDDPLNPYEVMQAVTAFLEVNKEWKVRFFSFGTESLQNIYISRIFDSEINA